LEEFQETSRHRSIGEVIPRSMKVIIVNPLRRQSDGIGK
jgi:hypothetical protein